MTSVRKLIDAAKLLGPRRFAQFLFRSVTMGHPRRLWNQVEPFLSVVKVCESRSLVDRPRCLVLHSLARQCRNLEGDAAEVGVYRGGTARLIAEALEGSGKSLHLFDTFEGMPETNPGEDFVVKGDFGDTSLQSVRSFVGDRPLVEFHQGRFPDTAGSLLDRRFSFVHADADIHEAMSACCEFFYPRMVSGGFMVFDDYGSAICQGAQRAVDEFFAEKREVPVYLPTGQCLVCKL